jgi:4,5-DOPA dioxygenase extradiol
MISAHWETRDAPALSFAAQPETIHDFGGFPQALFEIRYPAPGAPDLAARAATLLANAGVAVARHDTRGLDHGAWVPLSLMYPQADIPVAQLSLVRGAPPAAHLAIGRALQGLPDEGVLVIGSGSLTHNLHEYFGQEIDAEVPDWVAEFGHWMKEQLEASRYDALLAYRNQAPSAARNHPTEEHLLPLFVAMGAAGIGAAGRDACTRRLHASYEYGVLAMDAYAFDAA